MTSCAYYDLTEKNIENKVLLEITNIASTYGKDALDVDILLSILYMAMIAEERKKFSRLGKRIKRLGIYKLLIENKDVDEAANFMRGMKWCEIDNICKKHGF